MYPSQMSLLAWTGSDLALTSPPTSTSLMDLAPSSDSQRNTSFASLTSGML